MIKFKTKIGDFNLATSYSDISCREYKQMRDNPEDHIAIVKILTGLTEDKILFLDLDEIAQYLEFLKVPALDSLEEDCFIDYGNMRILPEKISQCTYGQKIVATKYLLNNDIEGIVATYLQPIIFETKFDSSKVEQIKGSLLGMNVSSVYSVGVYLINQLKEIVEREAELLKSEVTEQQKRAGIESFNVLGEFNTIDMIAKDYKYTHKEVEELEYDLIFLILYKNKLTSNFEKNYSEIIKET
jgi:hypothetical protein